MSWTNMSPKNHLFRVATVMTGLLGICGPAFAEAFSVTGGTVSRNTGQVTVNGTITCTSGDEIFLYGQVTQQKQTNRYAFGSGASSLTCNGSPQTWTIPTTNQNNFPFTAGKAGAYVQAYDSFIGTLTNVNVYINLKWIP